LLEEPREIPPAPPVAAYLQAFSRSVLLWVIDRQVMVTDRHDKYRPRIDRLKISRSAGLSPSR
jgi:hypothetical protein